MVPTPLLQGRIYGRIGGGFNGGTLSMMCYFVCCDMGELLACHNDQCVNILILPLE